MLDISNEDYHRNEGISSTNLIDLLQYSEAHMKHWMDNPVEPSRAMKDGTRFHTSVLEPDKFDSIYAVTPTLDGRTKEGKAAKEDFYAANSNKTLISQDEYDNTMRMRDAVLSSKTVQALLKGALIEKAFYATDPMTGVLIKARPDAINYKNNMLIDLKKTTQADIYHVKQSIRSYFYHVQASYHMNVVNGCQPDKLADIKDSIFIFCEDTAPYGVQIVAITPSDLIEGEKKWREALDRYAKCLKSGIYPGYSDSIQELNVFGGSNE